MKNSIKTNLALCLTFLFLGFLCFMGEMRIAQESLAARLSPSVLRFHILANSDSDEDQDVKLEIRSLLLDYMQKTMDLDVSKEETVQWVRDHSPELTNLADTYLEKNGFDYQSSLKITNDYFPTRVYDDLVFPCGNYDAVRITLGDGGGHNWWCVLYPQFCFVEEACEEAETTCGEAGKRDASEAPPRCDIPTESRNVLRRELKQGDYLALEDHRPDLEIRIKLLSWLEPQ